MRGSPVAVADPGAREVVDAPAVCPSDGDLTIEADPSRCGVGSTRAGLAVAVDGDSWLTATGTAASSSTAAAFVIHAAVAPMKTDVLVPVTVAVVAIPARRPSGVGGPASRNVALMSERSSTVAAHDRQRLMWNST